MKHTKKAVLALALVISLIVSGCFGDKGGDISSVEETKSDLNPVELIYYFPAQPQKDMDMVNERVNELLKNKINTTVKLNAVDFSTYSQKMNTLIATGEEFDICWTSSGDGGFFQNVSNGVFAPLDQLLEDYGADITKVVPESFWPAVTVKGEIYGVINFQQATAGFGYVAQKEILDRYKIDPTSLTKLSDLTPLLANVKRDYPKLVPYEMSRTTEPFTLGPVLFGMEELGDSKSPGWIYLNDKELRVINQYESPEFKEYLKLTREWYQKGYIAKDAATINDTSSDRKSGRNAVQFGQIDITTSEYSKMGLPSRGRMFGASGKESYDENFVNPVLTTSMAAATLNVISSSSENKERAMMFLNLLNSDKEIYNTICYGVEGVHYTKIAQNRIEYIDNSGYRLGLPWVFGYMGNAWYDNTWPKGAEINDKGNKAWIDLNKNAKQSPALGFAFIADNVKTEIANCKTVLDELYYPLATGSADFEKYLPMMLQRLKTAGADNIIKEKQIQLDRWKAENKK